MVRARIDTIPKRKDTSRSANFFCELLHAVNRIVTKFFRFVSGMLRVRFLLLMHDPNYVRRHEHIVLKCLSMNSGLRRS